MAKTLHFLQVSEARDKSNFLRHVHNLVHIQIKEKDTFEDLFKSLEAKFKDMPEELEAAREYIADIHFENTDHSVFKSEVSDIIPEPGTKLYAIFDLIPVK